jgi:hypothetical protein
MRQIRLVSGSENRASEWSTDKKNFPTCKALSTPQSRIRIFIYSEEQDVMIRRFCCCSNVCYCITICMSIESLTCFLFRSCAQASVLFIFALQAFSFLLTAVTSFLGPLSFLAILPRLPYCFLRQKYVVVFV